MLTETMMPKIDFCFSGYVRGANVTEVTDANGKQVSVSDLDAKTLAKKLESGELFISLGDHLYENRKGEIELFDFDESA
jgi:hypothetical protein